MWTIVRPPGTLGHAVYFANWLLYALFAGVGLLLAERARTWRLLGTAACAMCSLAIVLSGTRAAVVGLAAGVVFLFFRVRPRLRLRALGIALCRGFAFSCAGRNRRARWSSKTRAAGPTLERFADGGSTAGRTRDLLRAVSDTNRQILRAPIRILSRIAVQHLSDALANGIWSAMLLALCALGIRTGRRAT
jgi:hypothetical protein